MVGFAMFGAITFLPRYLQVVKGVNPSVSGLRLLPLMVGLLLTSTTSGQLISRWGHYKIVPIIGTALMTIGLLLLSRLGPYTTGRLTSLYMFVFGLGLGAVMQVLIIAVQNAVDYKDLGAATSGVTYFRSIGGSFGTAVFGSILSNRFTADIAHFPGTLRLPAGITSASLSPRADRASPGGPPRLHRRVRQLVAERVPGRGAGRRRWFRARVAAPGGQAAQDGRLPPTQARRSACRPDRSSLQELERAVAVLAQHENRVAVYHRISVQAGLEGLRPGACCLLSRIRKRSGITVAELAEEIRTPRSNLAPVLDQLTNRGLVARSTNGENLADLLQGWSPDAHPELAARLQILAAEFFDHDAQKLRTDDALRTAA